MQPGVTTPGMLSHCMHLVQLALHNASHLSARSGQQQIALPVQHRAIVSRTRSLPKMMLNSSNLIRNEFSAKRGRSSVYRNLDRACQPFDGRTSLLTASPDVLKRSSCKHKSGVAVHSAYLALVWEHHPSTDCCRQIVLPALSCMGNGASSGPVSSVMTPSGE